LKKPVSKNAIAYTPSFYLEQRLSMFAELSIADLNFFDDLHLQQQLDSNPKPWNGEMSALPQR
jgi:hypothetical protein